MRRPESVNKQDASERRDGRGRPSDLRPLRQLWPFMKPYRGTMALGVTALALAALTSLALPVGVRLVIDKGFAADSTQFINQYFLLLLGLTVLLSLFSAARFYFISWCGERVVANMKIASSRLVLPCALPPATTMLLQGSVISSWR